METAACCDCTATDQSCRVGDECCRPAMQFSLERIVQKLLCDSILLQGRLCRLIDVPHGGSKDNLPPSYLHVMVPDRTKDVSGLRKVLKSGNLVQDDSKLYLRDSANVVRLLGPNDEVPAGFLDIVIETPAFTGMCHATVTAEVGSVQPGAGCPAARSCLWLSQVLQVWKLCSGLAGRCGACGACSCGLIVYVHA